MHLFAVSGLHTGIVGLVVLFGLRLLGLPLWLRLLLLVLMVGGFAALVGGRASVLRAATLLVLFEASELLRRPVEPMAMLATVAAAMALLSPGLLRHVDFQMTFLCVAALIVVGPWMLEVRRALGRRLGWGRLATAAIATVETLIASTAIQLALLPVLAGRMGEVSLVAPLANVLCLATAGWVIVTTLFVLFAGFWAGALWGGLLPVAGWGAGLLDAAAHGLAAIPFAAVAAPPWPAWAALVWLALLVAGPWAALRHPIRPRRPAWAFAPGALAAGCLLLVPLVRPPAGAELQLWFLDVGQGDAILVRSPAGAWGLVDAGPPRMAHQLVGMLRRRGVDRLDWAVATHADADHIGGLAEVLDAIPCGRLYVGGGIAPTGEFAELAAVVARRRIPVATVRRGVGWLLPGGGVVDVLHPTDPFVDATDERNDASVVLLLRLGGRAVLLAGDAESPAEADLIAAVPRLLGADVLKAGHHGAATSTGGDWLDVVAPRLVVLSCGRNNSYGHPAPAVLDRLAARGIEVARTDMGGTIHLRIGRDGQVRWSSSR
jgi:competence protein ComEC